MASAMNNFREIYKNTAAKGCPRPERVNSPMLVVGLAPDRGFLGISIYVVTQQLRKRYEMLVRQSTAIIAPHMSNMNAN